MFRKLTTILAAAAVIFAMLPAVAALAAPTGTGTIVTGANVFPGAGRDVAIRVDNGGIPLVGESINWVSVILPNEAGVRTTATPPAPPSGWTVTVTNTSTVQRYLYTATGSGIAPGSNLTFPFKADIAAPAADRTAEFRVFASSDRGATTSRLTGSLTSAIRTLELLTFGITAPAGAADGSATSGQLVTFTSEVTNHASGAQSVTVGAADGQTALGGTTQSIASGQTVPVAYPVTLPTVTQNSSRTITGTATATGSQAITRTANVALQLAPQLSLVVQSFQPNRVRSDAAPIGFTVNATKSNTPALTVDACTLTFDAGGTLNEIPLAGSVSWTANNAQALTFQPRVVRGADGQHAATVSCSGTDGNGAAYGQTPVNGTLQVVIDTVAPLITNLVITPPSGQTAVKGGDTVSVRFDVDDTAAQITVAEVRDDAGQVAQIANLSRSGNTYTGSATLTGFTAPQGLVSAIIQARDFADGNTGGAQSGTLVLDNIVPAVLDPARTTSTTTIEVLIDDNSAVSGGCNRGHWQVEDNLVTAVSGLGDEACGDSAYRILTLAQAIDITATPAVTYNQMGLTLQQQPIRDGAANRALTRTVDTVVGILPPAPTLVTLTRNGGQETATQDEQRGDLDVYWTRFSTKDGVDDLQVTFLGARNGYSAEVVDGNGARIGNAIPLSPNADNEATIRVPLGAAQGEYVRGIRLINAAGTGPATNFVVALDQTLPGVGTATISGQEVTVSFSEVLWAGANLAGEWFGYQTTSAGETAAYQPARVDIREGNRTTRVLTFEFDDPTRFTGEVDYLNSNPDTRYVDRAGNALADTLS